MPLTDSQCRTAKAKSNRYKLSDYDGLYLEIMPTGSKSWRLKYRLNKKESRITLGAYPQVSLAEARQRKLEVKAELMKGLNPVLTKIEKDALANFSASQTFELVAREWHTKNIEKWKPDYAQTVLHRLEKYLFPDLGMFPINSLKPIIILRCLQKAEVTAPDLTRRLKGYCHHIFVYAIVTELAENDPTYGLEKALKEYRKGHYASISVDRLPTFLIDLHEYKPNLTRQTFLAIKFMFLTFIRTREMIKATWDEFNFEKSLWSIPAERMKMKRPHLVPLPRQAIDILLELRQMNGNCKYVFAGFYDRRKHMSNCTIIVALKRMGYKGRMTGHGFRALAMGILKEKLGYNHELVKKQLAHAPKSSVDAAYDRAEFLPQRTEMLQRYADYLDSVHIEEITKKYSFVERSSNMFVVV